MLQSSLRDTQRIPPGRPAALRIDAHHHLWNYSPQEYAWLDASMAALRRNFTVDDLASALQTAHMDAAIAVQARQTIAETTWLLESAEATDKICGVVGWAPLLDSALPATLDLFASRNKLLGMREIVQAEPAGYLDQPSFNRGIEELTRRSLTYDLLLRENQLVEAIRFVDRHPRQRFVLDHAAKPRIAARELQPWKANLHALAQRSHVYCKLSGLVTEAQWSNWTIVTLRPYLDVCVEAFGPSRLMAGSDWPVCLVASTYPQWWSVLSEYFAAFTEQERQHIFGATAIKFYKPAVALLPAPEVSR